VISRIRLSYLQTKGNKMVNTETHHRYHLTNNYERAVFLKGDEIGPAETARYRWADKQRTGTSVLDLGCSSGFGRQFLTAKEYTGLDYDANIIKIAKQQDWHPNSQFTQANIYEYPLAHYDTIIAFEFIEHFNDGLAIMERLKNHCNTLLITVPHRETVGFWGEHHRLHGLSAEQFKDFKVCYSDLQGKITQEPAVLTITNPANLMLGAWQK
jgi:2-polyprenyl-3-methyl-5-hydroxy-6-metoxy-1,4-benzoquinol methylase